MTAHEIVALRCPACGGGISNPSRALAFGAEFRCDHCGVVSVLIVDQALVALSTLQREGERVCTSCGRVATRIARFCQEGHSLVRKCINQACLKEFAVDHQRCDHCGWLQEVKPGTDEGIALEMKRAVADLSDPSAEIVAAAIHKLRLGGSAARDVSQTAVPAILKVIGSLQVPEHVSFRQDQYPHDVFCESWETLAAIGPAATAAVPLLRQKVEQAWSTDNKAYFFLRCLVHIAPREALMFCERIWSEENSGTRKAEYAVHVAYFAGEAAIPSLSKVSGFFGVSGAKNALRALRSGYAWQPAPRPG